MKVALTSIRPQIDPITYSEAINPAATPQDAYKGSKVFAEREAWDFMEKKSPTFDSVTLCPSMVFGPVASPIHSPKDLNESNALLWRIATGGPGQPLPPAQFNFWIDVPGLAEIYVQALVNKAAGGKRYMPVAPEKFTYQLVSEIVAQDFPSLGVSRCRQEVKSHINADLETVTKDFPDVQYRKFRDTVVEFISQVSSFPVQAFIIFNEIRNS
ncbi:Fc.00g105380.m01.CDS01 [Cosmosporella sp. VM-42]